MSERECFGKWDDCKFVEQESQDEGNEYTIMKILCDVHHDCYLAYRDTEKQRINEILDRRVEVSRILS